MRFLPLLAFAALAAGSAGPGWAHPKLVSSSPVANGSASGLKTISLTFSEGLVAPVSGAELVMQMAGAAPMKIAGVRTSVGKDGKTLIATMDKPLPAGRYSLNWHVVSTDTHRIAGELPFSVK